MTDPPYVAMVLLNNTSLGGAERRFAQVYEGLRARKVPIALAINESLLAGLRQGGLLQPEGELGLVVKERVGRLKSSLAFSLRKLDYLFACVSVGCWLRRSRPQVLHLVLGGAYVALPLQVVGAAPPAVVSVVCPNLREMVGSRLGYRLYRRALRLARVVDVLTDSIRINLEREGVQRERISVSRGSCIDTARFQPGSGKQPRVVFVGRLVEEKNALLFVEACAVVRTLVPTARFYLLGDGPLRRAVDDLVKQRGLEPSMTVGWCERVERVLAEALVFVSLQRTDNYPSQALLEAMACGAAVVATNVGLTSKLVDDRVGVLVEADPAAVAEAVARLLEHPEEARAMGLKARARVVQEHSTDAYLDYLVGLYASARRAEDQRR